jgi:hypothetical protein
MNTGLDSMDVIFLVTKGVSIKKKSAYMGKSTGRINYIRYIL